MAPDGMKKIFIIDIHLGDKRSFAPPNPYSMEILTFIKVILFLKLVSLVVPKNHFLQRWPNIH